MKTKKKEVKEWLHKSYGEDITYDDFRDFAKKHKVPIKSVKCHIKYKIEYYDEVELEFTLWAEK